MSSSARRQVWSRPSIVSASYLVAAIVMTWPLVTIMNRRIAGDMGDPLFNCWVLLWTGGQLLRALHGDLSALSHYWDANIFYPAPLTLAYSEHLTPQMLQILPLLAATDNVILCYNVLLLGTFVLSGLGMYLLVRELTGQPLAAFLAGLAFAFAPYRIDQYTHLEVVSSQWMPFALYGFRRFFVTSRLRPLVGGAVALLAQALSCGYYMAYFTPFAAAYCVYEMAARGTLGDRRTWRALVVAGAAVLIVVALFLRPYFHARAIGEVGVRDPGDIQQFSADTRAFATISSSSRLLGTLVRSMPRNENQGFPGFTILAFATVAIGFGLARAVTGARQPGDQLPWGRRALALTLATAVVALALLLANVLVTGALSPVLSSVITIRHDAGTRLFGGTAVAIVALLLVSPWVRRVARGTRGSAVGFFACAAVAAALMSLGPVMYANGRRIGPGLYSVFYRWIPGFDGLRVVSLNFMLVALFLAVLAGLGAAALGTRWRGAGRALVALGMVAILAESWSVPTAANDRLPAPGYAWPPREIADVPQVYRAIRGLPAETVVAEFPFGAVAYEIRYVFYSGYHRRRIVNGYSGFSPASYARLVPLLSHIPAGADAWQALLSSGATHAIVHETAFLDQDGVEVSEWLRRSGAREIAVAQSDRVFQLR
ncbi:MAG: hypothetical protein HY047_20110 [Acidobacteria bacterium]|nr:hypothetical protein [Acidobacteriota bacterium]